MLGPRKGSELAPPPIPCVYRLCVRTLGLTIQRSQLAEELQHRGLTVQTTVSDDPILICSHP